MGPATFEPLEPRTHLSATPAPHAPDAPQRNEPTLLGRAPATSPRLSGNNVRTLLAQAASQASPRQAIVIVDRQGFILGIFGMADTNDRFIAKAAARARTAAFFQSAEEAFTTRTARFIVQDRFPHPVPNTPGGPLYGVEFSSLRPTDILSPEQTPAISGDPGGVPLYKNGLPVGGIGVAGDARDVCVRRDLRNQDFVCPAADNPDRRFFNGVEENDRDEAVALAGARGFMAPERIRATQIFLDGLRLPFTADQPASLNPDRTLNEIIADGDGSLRAAPDLFKNVPDVVPSVPETVPSRSFAGVGGHEMNPIIESDDTEPVKLTRDDVKQVIADAVRKAKNIRAAIRLPIGTNAIVHIAVVDRKSVV